MKRIAILTGASSGMGRELALQLAQWETFDELWVIARRADRLEALKEQVPFPVRPISLDLTDRRRWSSTATCWKTPGRTSACWRTSRASANSAATTRSRWQTP